MNTFKKALGQGTIKEGDYFEVRYPDGMVALFRLFKTEKGYVMLGPPTTKEVLFRGKEGYDNLFALADSQARKEYSNDVFEDVHACSLPKREYRFESYDKLRAALVKFSKMYDFSDTSAPPYALASRCVLLDSYYAFFRMFYVGSGTVNARSLYNSYTYAGSNSYAVRPEAIPKPTMKFLEEDCDGSQERPWVCLGSQEEKIPEQSKEGTSQDEGIINIDKDRLMSLIKEGHELNERVACWLAELEEYAKNLK